jgi:hypothetical protein
MKRRTALALCCTGLLSVAGFAGDEAKAEQKVPACCAKKDAKAVAEKGGKLRCSLTGKEVDKCCCEQREGGKLFCTLAKKDVDKCCCSEAKGQGKDAK